MKSLMLLLCFAIGLTCSSRFVVFSQTDQAQVSLDAQKIKVKSGKTIVRDKSKPVRRAIEEWYARNMKAFEAKDVAAIMALRTDDFHTLTPDGRINTRADMETRTSNFLDRIDHFISQDFKIGVIDVQGDLASADISQDTVRMQRLPDGTLHKVQALAVQRETWKRTTAGWKLYRVDNIRDGGVFVDGKPTNPDLHFKFSEAQLIGGRAEWIGPFR